MDSTKVVCCLITYLRQTTVAISFYLQQCNGTLIAARAVSRNIAQNECLSKLVDWDVNLQQPL